MAENLANRHAARLKQIQEAQEAHQRETMAARGQAAAASETTGGPARPSPPQVTVRSSDTAPDGDGDEYHFPSEDDAFLASLDLDALDEGVGRPIDFEEGARPDVDTSGDVTMDEGARQAAAQDQQHRADTSPGTSAGAHPPSSHTDQRAHPARQGQYASRPSGERAKTPSMGGGFHFPPGAGGGQNADPAHARGMAAHGSSANGASSVSLKRNADIMQGISAAQSRRPAQGMGLQHAAGVQSGAKREPFAALETTENGSVKRFRR
ncbi:hypothetical protein BD413DRAFT_484663 [Trametes elegans]|nr:hypothetical protein BD413DRAFT_484663 [Trametes elegans]